MEQKKQVIKKDKLLSTELANEDSVITRHQQLESTSDSSRLLQLGNDIQITWDQKSEEFVSQTA